MKHFTKLTCLYHMSVPKQRAALSICRVMLHLKFFWLFCVLWFFLQSHAAEEMMFQIYITYILIISDLCEIKYFEVDKPLFCGII